MPISLVTNFDDINNVIISWLKDNAQLNSVSFKNQIGDRGVKPYGTILVTSSNIKKGFDEVRQEFNVPAQALDKTVLGQRQMKIQIEVYSNPATATGQQGARTLLEQALMTLEAQSVIDLFKAANVAYIDHTPINNLDEQLGDRWERRAQTDLTLNYVSEIIDTGSNDNWIENTEVPTEKNSNLTVNI